MGTDDSIKSPLKRRLELKITAILGSFTVILSSALILWVLGAFDDIGPRPLLEAEQFEVSAKCTVDGEYQVELELHDLKESYVEIIYFNKHPLATICTSFTIKASQSMKVERAYSMGWLKGASSIDGYRQTGSAKIPFHTHLNLGATKPEPVTKVTINLQEGAKNSNSLFVRLALPELSNKLDFSRGRARASFFVEGAKDTEDSTRFFAIVHQDLRHSRIQGVNLDPMTPNVFQYSPKRYEIEGKPNPTKVVLFDVEFDSIPRNKLRDILLVAFSTLFGVGVSILFESLLLAELLKRVSEIMR